MTTGQRFRAILHKQPVDRIPHMEWATWWQDQTLARWRTEGLDPAIGLYDIGEHLGLDGQRQFWVPLRKDGLPAPAVHSGGIICDRADYAGIKQYLYPESLPDDFLRAYEKAAERQALGEIALWFSIEGFFWFPRTLLGIENHLYAFYDQPELLAEINDDLLQYGLKTIERLCAIAVPDFMTFAEDMSYNHGPMLSKESFDLCIRPYYERILPALHARDIVAIVDSDGDITRLIPWFLEMPQPVSGFLPFERQAGCDLVKIRESHPQLIIIGGFDKMVMHLGEDAMRREFERLLPVMRQGGYIVSVDHQTPPAVSLEQYRLYVRLLKEYCGKI